MSTLKSVCGNREQKLRGRGQGTKCLQTPCGPKFIRCQQVTLQDSLHFTFSLFLSLLQESSQHLPRVFFSTFLGYIPWSTGFAHLSGSKTQTRHETQVWSGDVERALCRYHCREHLCLGHSLRATLPPPQREVYTEVMQYNWIWHYARWSPRVQINIAKSKVFQLITFIIQT